MAHTCPECGQYCTCEGDWDDCDFGEDPDCICCLGREEDDEDDDPYYVGLLDDLNANGDDLITPIIPPKTDNT